MAIRDYALYNASLAAATNGTYTAASSDYPTILYIGPSYFESYDTWPGVKFIHGFNLAKNTSEDRQLLLDYVPLVCKALEKSDGFFHWELGNEPDLYKVCNLSLDMLSSPYSMLIQLSDFGARYCPTIYLE